MVRLRKLRGGMSVKYGGFILMVKEKARWQEAVLEKLGNSTFSNLSGAYQPGERLVERQRNLIVVRRPRSSQSAVWAYCT
jgi:hypothetical protein